MARKPTPQQLALLEVINQNPYTAAQLAELAWATPSGGTAQRSRSTITHALRRLEDRNMVRRTYPAQAGGRQQVVWQITADGEKWAGLPD